MECCACGRVDRLNRIVSFAGPYGWVCAPWLPRCVRHVVYRRWGVCGEVFALCACRLCQRGMYKRGMYIRNATHNKLQYCYLPLAVCQQVIRGVACLTIIFTFNWMRIFAGLFLGILASFGEVTVERWYGGGGRVAVL